VVALRNWSEASQCLPQRPADAVPSLDRPRDAKLQLSH
jgi:hypothetical protein